MTLPSVPQERRIRPRSRAAAVVRLARSAAGSFDCAVGDELECEHRPEAAHVSDLSDAGRELVELRADVGAELLCASTEVVRGDLVQDGQRGRAGDRIAAERSSEPSRVRRVHHLGAARHRGEREPAAERLAGDEQVRLGPVVLDRPDRPRTPDARLHLVVHVEDAALAAELGEAPREVAGHVDEAAFALHRLEDDAGDLVRVEQLGHGFDRRRSTKRRGTGRAPARDEPPERTARTPSCTSPCASSSSSAESARGMRSRRRRRRACRSLRARS